MIGFFGSFSAFTVPFVVLLTTGQLTDFEDLESKERTLVVWEWLLFPVGFALYFFTFFFYWVFRRLRRVLYEKEAKKYHHQCFESNRTFLEFLLIYKSAKTRAIEAKLEKT